MFHSDESLSEEYTLMDIAYIYTWRRVRVRVSVLVRCAVSVLNVWQCSLVLISVSNRMCLTS